MSSNSYNSSPLSAVSQHSYSSVATYPGSRPVTRGRTHQPSPTVVFNKWSTIQPIRLQGSRSLRIPSVRKRFQRNGDKFHKRLLLLRRLPKAPIDTRIINKSFCVPLQRCQQLKGNPQTVAYLCAIRLATLISYGRSPKLLIREL